MPTCLRSLARLALPAAWRTLPQASMHDSTQTAPTTPTIRRIHVLMANPLQGDCPSSVPARQSERMGLPAALDIRLELGTVLLDGLLDRPARAVCQAVDHRSGHNAPPVS